MLIRVFKCQKRTFTYLKYLILIVYDFFNAAINSYMLWLSDVYWTYSETIILVTVWKLYATKLYKLQTIGAIESGCYYKMWPADNKADALKVT